MSRPPREPPMMNRRHLLVHPSLLLLTGLGQACVDPQSGSSSPSFDVDLGLGEAPQYSFVSTELFISEYIEGSSNNKAIEIFNGTTGPVSLTPYSLQFFFNGSTTAATTIALSGTVASGDVFVVADNDAAAAILAQADLTPTSNFNNG